MLIPCLFVDVAICFCFIFIPFTTFLGTNLLTQWLVLVSVCYCLCITEKGEKSILPKNSRNSKMPEDSRSPKGSRRGPTPWPGALLARPGVGRALWPPGQVGPPPVPPFEPIYSSSSENPRGGLLFQFTSLFCRHRDPEIGISRSSIPTPYRRED